MRFAQLLLVDVLVDLSIQEDINNFGQRDLLEQVAWGTRKTGALLSEDRVVL
jgi:hypothetical protein